MLYLFLLITYAFASFEQLNVNSPTVEDATQKCVDAGYDGLCSKAQGYSVVFGTQDYSLDATHACFTSGWFSDVMGGWYTQNPCGSAGAGWRSWVNTGNGPKPFCCNNNVQEAQEATCADVGKSACTGTRQIDEAEEDTFCPDGDCSDDLCCQDWSPVDLYKSMGGYTFTSGEEAEAACVAESSDYELCTEKQVIGAVTYDTSYRVCSSGWFKMYDVASASYTYNRGWMVNEDNAAGGFCGGNGGWRTWQKPDGTGSAHCCVKSYMNPGYVAAVSADPVAFCASENYHTSVCTLSQMMLAATTEQSASNICKSGVYTGDDGSDGCGWYQADSNCGGEGLKGWCRGAGIGGPTVHCCLPYVMDYVPDYTVGEYDIMPEKYSESTLATGGAAESYCVELGYAGLCSQGQHRWVMTNDADVACMVGWVKNADGDYISGYWGSSNCNKAEDWYDAWQPSNPVAHCCQADVEQVEMTVASYEMHTDYNLADEAAALSACQAMDAGYRLCTDNEVKHVAEQGVTVPEGDLKAYWGNVNAVPSMCRSGHLDSANSGDYTFGWYQVADTACGRNGRDHQWRDWMLSSGLAGAHCCATDVFGAMEVEEFYLLAPEPTPAPTIAQVAAYAMDRSYGYGDEAAALGACQAMSDKYRLCSDNEVRHVAMNGISSSDALYSSVDAQTSICRSGYLSTELSAEYAYGWYQVDEVACGKNGKNNQWREWIAGTKLAGAHCCAGAVWDATEVEQAYSEEEETTPSPTEEETTPSPTKTPTDEPATTTTTTLPPTKMPTELPTVFVPYSGLPSTVAFPGGCVERPELTPEGFENVLVYCVVDGNVYLNGRDTCIQDGENVDSDVSNAFENDWYFSADGCSSKSYDTAMDDQLFVTNEQLNDLESDIDQLESDMDQKSADLDSYLADWKEQIAALLESSVVDGLDADTATAVNEYIATNLRD